MRIEFLFSPTCANSPKALKLLKKVLKEEKIADPIEELAVASAEEARKRGMFGSPSIRIDGKDIEDKPADTPTTYT